MRMQCLCTLQPYSNKNLDAKDIMQFPWDNEGEKKKEKEGINKEEMMRRYKAAKAAANLK